MQRGSVDPHPPAFGRVLGAFVALVALGGSAAWLLRSYLVTDVATVPALTGSTLSEATEQLKGVGLSAAPFVEADPTAPPGVVLSQSPLPGSEVRLGRSVALGVNQVLPAPVAPDLLGMREREALLRAEEAGLRAVSIAYAASDLPVGSVAAQTPLPRAPVAPGSSLLLTVSRGPEFPAVVVPDLRGVTIDEAAALAGSLGFRRVERVPVPLAGAEPGIVTDQRPAPGIAASPTTPLALVHVVDGADLIQVPVVAGFGVEDATAALTAVGLPRGAIRWVEDPTLPRGVIATLPAGTTLAGSPIALIVNEAGAAFGADEPIAPPTDAGDAPADPAADVPAPGTTRVEEDGARVIPFRFDPAAVGIGSLMRDAYLLQLVVVDAEGERVAYDERLAPGEAVAIPIRVVGDDPLVQTFINGSFFQAWRP